MKKRDTRPDPIIRKRLSSDVTWYGLDNAANLFPAISNDRNTNVFRISCELHENIQKSVLQEALNRAMPDFLYFRVAMHRGLFWYYMEEVDQNPLVAQESRRPCERIFYHSQTEPLFRVSYYGRRINLEMFHSISDGGGAVNLLRAIVYQYLVLIHRNDLPEQLPPLDCAAPPSQRVTDSFDYNYDPREKQSHFQAKAYALSGTLLPANSLKFISARIHTSEILKLAKSKGVTVTIYLCALMICSIYSGLMPKRATHQPVAVNVPVDLRGHFPSQTARNYFGVVEVSYNFEGKSVDFEAVLTSVKEQMARQVTAESLARRANYTMSVQRNVFAGITPLFLKNLVLRIAYHRSESATSCAMSNMGRITMPEEFSPYIDAFHCLLNPTLQHRIKATVCSYRDQFVINLTTCIEETTAQQYFLRHLVSQGVDIIVTGNGGIEDEAM